MAPRRIVIRDAVAADAAAICDIYNQGIEDRLATLETELRTPAERAEWLASRGPRHPVLVAIPTEPGTTSNRPPASRSDLAPPAPIAAWASLNRSNPRPAYDHVVELSVYVDRAARGQGVGHALLEALVDRARGLGYHKMVLAAFPTNTPGIALYLRLGFTQVGVYREQGLLDGRWVDVVVMERLL